MNKFFISTSTAVALLATSLIAQAADLPTKTYVPAPVVAQVYNWTGFYVGANGGYGWGTTYALFQQV
jgi:outer membrane immunogenic protein